MPRTTNEKSWFRDRVNENALALFRLASSILRNDADAEDAVQETLITAYKKLDTLRDRRKFKPWIMQILVNTARQTFRKQKNLVPLDSVSELPAGDNPDPDNTLSLWPAVQALSDDLRTVTVLFYYDDLSVREISRVTGVKPGAIKTRLSRARQKLRDTLSEEGMTHES